MFLVRWTADLWCNMYLLYVQCTVCVCKAVYIVCQCTVYKLYISDYLPALCVYLPLLGREAGCTRNVLFDHQSDDFMRAFYVYVPAMKHGLL